MLFHVSWKYHDRSETTAKRSMGLFARWKPGPVEFKSLYSYADGTGGFAIVDAASVEDLAKTIAPWTPFQDFVTQPILPLPDMARINGEAAAWRDAK